MRIYVAQTRPVRGDIDANVRSHLRFIEVASDRGAEMLFFPELSLTGYEPEWAAQLALEEGDQRLDLFQATSEARGITLGVGMPLRTADGIWISMVVFQPNRRRVTYSKKYLHPDEEQWFVAGPGAPVLETNRGRIALAICYEISIGAHLESAREHRPAVYVASVAKTMRGVEAAVARLSAIARENAWTVLMANSVGASGDGECGGRSSIWNSSGELVGQLDGEEEGMLGIDHGASRVIAAHGPGGDRRAERTAASPASGLGASGLA